jgi:hypothetical protein
MGDTTRASNYFWQVRRELESGKGKLPEKTRQSRWEEFYRAASPSIRKWLTRWEMERHVDPFLQATFGVLMDQMTDPKFKSPSSFRGWLPVLIRKAIREWYKQDPTKKQVQLASEFVEFLQDRVDSSPLDSILAAEAEIDENLQKEERKRLLRKARRIVKAEYCGPNAKRSNATTWRAYEYARKRVKYPEKSEAALKQKCGVSGMSDGQIATCASRVKAKIERVLEKLLNQ